MANSAASAACRIHRTTVMVDLSMAVRSGCCDDASAGVGDGWGPPGPVPVDSLVEQEAGEVAAGEPNAAPAPAR